MISGRNIVVLEGGLTRDPETVNDGNILTFSIGVDGAGSEKGVQNPSGYFDIKLWLTPSEFSAAATARQAKEHLTQGNLTKGTRVRVVGRLSQDRWTNDNGKTSKVVVIAESIDVYTPKNSGGSNSHPAGSVASAAATSAPLSLNDF